MINRKKRNKSIGNIFLILIIVNLQFALTLKGYGDLNIHQNVFKTKDKGFILINKVKLEDINSIALKLYKTDNSGELIWSRKYGIDNDIKIRCIKHIKYGEFLITGYRHHKKSNNIFVLKTNENGNIEWEYTFAKEGIQVPNFLSTTKSDEIIIVGYSTQGHLKDYNPVTSDIYILAISSAGNVLWDKELGFKDIDEEACTLIQNKNSELLIAGIQKIYQKQNIYLTKLDITGTTKWKKSYAFDEFINDLKICSIDHRNYMITGTLQENNSNDFNSDKYSFSLIVDDAGDMINLNIFKEQKSLLVFTNKVINTGKPTPLTGIVNTERVRLRNSPSLNSEVLAQFSLGDSVKILKNSIDKVKINDTIDYWYLLESYNNETGWMFGKFIDINK